MAFALAPLKLGPASMVQISNRLSQAGGNVAKGIPGFDMLCCCKYHRGAKGRQGQGYKRTSPSYGVVLHSLKTSLPVDVSPKCLALCLAYSVHAFIELVLLSTTLCAGDARRERKYTQR